MTLEEKNESLQQDKIRYVRWIPIAMLYLGVAGFGFIQGFTTSPYLDWAVRLFISVSAIYWVALDARARHQPIPHIAQPLLLSVWILVVPIWLVRTRGFAGLGWSVLHAIGLVVVFFGSFCLTLYVFWGPEALFQN